MTLDQAAAAVALLNTYARRYLGLPLDAVTVEGGRLDGNWILMVTTEVGVRMAADFDEGKQIIDAMTRAGAAA